MGGYGLGAMYPVPMIETNNSITRPTGPEWQFLVGEGKYRQDQKYPWCVAGRILIRS